MGKVFGYPEFDANGEKILTTYDNEYKDMMMDIRVYRMKAGETRSFKRDGEELAVLLLSGNITYAWDGNKETVSRKDVFTEGPWCVHVCTGTEVSVTAEADSEILVQCTRMIQSLQQIIQTGGCSLGLFLQGQIRKCCQEKSQHHL